MKKFILLFAAILAIQLVYANGECEVIVSEGATIVADEKEFKVVDIFDDGNLIKIVTIEDGITIEKILREDEEKFISGIRVEYEDYFGALSPGRFLPQSCTLAPGFACSDFVIDNVAAGSNDLTIVVRNGIGAAANRVTFTVREQGQTTDCADIDPANPTSISEGGESTFLWDCPGVDDTTTQGSRFKAALTMSYVLAGQTLTHTVTGDLTARVGIVSAESVKISVKADVCKSFYIGESPYPPYGSEPIKEGELKDYLEKYYGKGYGEDNSCFGRCVSSERNRCCYIAESGEKVCKTIASCDEKQINLFCKEKCYFEKEVCDEDECLFDDRCIPIGVRAKGQYCSYIGEMLPQLGGGKFCENNFECVTNSCLDGQCTEFGFWQKFFKWFSRFA